LTSMVDIAEGKEIKKCYLILGKDSETGERVLGASSWATGKGRGIAKKWWFERG